jgi:tetratricopeptide (TPR) repeat protein
MLSICLFASCAFAISHVSACIWDSDTIASELARFPGIAEVMTGQFPRHSREFYEWRRKTVEESLSKDPQQVALYDDLAVAQHKLGDHKAAIATMMKKDKVKPDLYETFSNIGTFYIYTGELQTAVNWIGKALVINPNAHFGREKYQKWLLNWIMERKDKGEPDDEESGILRKTKGFARFVALQQSTSAGARDPKEDVFLTAKQRDDAIAGVVGMMRFADFDNPILQEALGDLLASGQLDWNASHLAALAYLHAAQKSSDPDDQKRLKERYDWAKRFMMKQENADLERMLANGLAKGKIYADAVRADELAWIAAGQDASAEFQKKYLAK